MTILRLVLGFSLLSAASVARAQQHTFDLAAPAPAPARDRCSTAFLQSRSDLILALRRAIPLSDVATMRATNQAFIAGVKFAVSHHGWDGSREALNALVQSHHLNASRAHMVCPPGYQPVPVGYGACSLAWAGAPGAFVEPLSETRGSVVVRDGRVIFRASTRFTTTVAYHGRNVLLTRGFITTDYDVAADTSTEGSSYGVTAATRFDGEFYNEFLQQEAQALCSGS